jgi:hypothetical protein
LRKATLESFEVASNVFKASAKDSLFDIPKLETFPAEASDFIGKEVAEDGLNSPVHAFGVDQAFGGGGAGFGSSVIISAEEVGAGCVGCSPSTAGVVGT